MRYKFIIALLLLHSCLFAQSRQAEFYDSNNAMAIVDSKADHAGNIVHAAVVYLSSGVSFTPYTMIIKTDIAGNVIWSRRMDLMADHFEPVKIAIATNGDYLVLARQQVPFIIRIDTAGNVIWSKEVWMNSNVVNHNVTGITELPNGNIVVCGYNDFYYSSSSGSYQWEGYLLTTDSAGNVLSFKSYGQNQNAYSFSSDLYEFQDIVCINNRMIVCGAYGHKGLNKRGGLLVMLDLNGRVTKTRRFDTPVTTGNKNLVKFVFNDIIFSQGKVIVSGFADSADGLSDHVYQLIAAIDTTNFFIKANVIRSDAYTYFDSPHFAVKDTSEIYTIAFPTSTNAFVPRKGFLAKIQNDTIAWAKKIGGDSILFLNSLTLKGDTIVAAGRANRAGCGFFLAFDKSASSSQLCNVTDTNVTLLSFTGLMTTIADTPKVHNIPYSIYPSTAVKECVYEKHICGTPACSPYLKPPLAALPGTHVCPGDTVTLVTSGCFNKSWFYNGNSTSTGDTLFAAAAGTYYVVTGHDGCSDTSDAVNIIVNAVPNPVITRVGITLQTMMFASYQWLDQNQNIIPGATSSVFTPDSSGNYFVRVTDSAGCEGISVGMFFDGGQAAVSAVGLLTTMVFPNPTSGVFAVQVTQGARLEIVDMQGRVNHRQQLKTGNNKVTLPDRLSDGVYFLHVIANNGTTKTVMKLMYWHNK